MNRLMIILLLHFSRSGLDRSPTVILIPLVSAYLLLRPCLGQRAPDALRLYANADKTSLLWFSPAQFNPPRFALGAIGERASDANRLARLFLRFAFKRRQRCPKRAHSHPVSLWNVTEGGRGIWHACKGIGSETHVCLLFMLSILSHLVCNHIWNVMHENRYMVFYVTSGLMGSQKTIYGAPIW